MLPSSNEYAGQDDFHGRHAVRESPLPGLFFFAQLNGGEEKYLKPADIRMPAGEPGQPEKGPEHAQEDQLQPVWEERVHAQT